jgi:hypothetical protein
MAEEEPTSRVSRIRGGLPGEEWRKHVSEGSERAYEGPLAPSRAEARQLRHKGRLIAAHRKEKGAFKIRARGYDRKMRGEEPVKKAMGRNPAKVLLKNKDLHYKKTVHRIGPYQKTSVDLRNTPPSRSEERRENVIAAGKALGGVRTAAAVALGAGGGATLLNEVHERGQKAAESVRNKTVRKKEPVTKQLDIYDIIGKSWDEYDEDGLVDIHKSLLGSLGGAFRGAAAADKPLGQFGRKMYSSASQAAGRGEDAFAAGRKTFDEGGGFGGLADKAQQSFTNPTARKVVGGAALVGGTGALAWGAKKGAQKFAQLGRNRVDEAVNAYKPKAKKLALYGAAGLGGTVAAGTALGNAATNR